MTICELRGPIHPLTGESRRRNGHERSDLIQLRAQPARRQREVQATYDAARDSDEFRSYWANADGLDADSANSRAVRTKLVQRSRYEVANNGYVDGLVQTHANYLIGVGPSLRVQSGNAAFNTEVETQWYRWTKAIQFRRKLWCMAHAKVQDGELIGICRSNPRLPHPVKLDLVLVESEQCQTPQLPYSLPGYIDGIKFDEFGNPEWYDILPLHPGGQFGFSLAAQPERVPARFILHWFQLRRPGQHRGVPELRSTLNVGAASRRMREATVAGAEAIARLGAVTIKTQLPPDDADPVTPLSSIEIPKGTMTALPMGWEAMQLKPEQPGVTYQEFLRSQINETARPKSVPYNLAACDSSSYNYASGRLDHQTYYIALDVEREDCSDLVLDPLLALWWQEAVLVFGWDADPSEPPPHQWAWPKHPVADIQAESAAKDTRLRNGLAYLSQLYAEEGRDFEDELPQMAQDHGVDVAQMRELLRHALLNSQNQQSAMLSAQTQAKASEQEAENRGQASGGRSQEANGPNQESGASSDD